MRCGWCNEPFTPARRDAIYCGRRCRQTAFRLRRRGFVASRGERPMRFAYADPPYPGLAARYYSGEPSFAGEVDHPALLSRLQERRLAGELDGWALSSSFTLRTLRLLLPHLPEEAEVHPWIKPIGVSSATFGPHQVSEILIVVPGRKLRPGFRNGLIAQPARKGGDLVGRKPLAFCAWLFRHLGMLPGDALEDLYPGTGIVGRAWAQICREASTNANILGSKSPTDSVA